jgi:hypothetical protein
MFPLDYRKAGKSCPKTSTRSRKRLLGQSKMLLSWDSFFLENGTSSGLYGSMQYQMS